MNLAGKYRPQRIEDFAGLEKPKQILANFASRPYGSAWLFHGRSGSGKSAMAQALAAQLGAELHTIPAADLSRDTMRSLEQTCANSSALGPARHVVVIDHADLLPVTRQIGLRSFLEPSTAEQTIWILIAVSPERIEEGLRSRCLQLHFSTHGTAPAASALLEKIWNAEATNGAVAPNFVRIVKETKCDLRTAISQLEALLRSTPSRSLAPETPVSPSQCAPPM